MKKAIIILLLCTLVLSGCQGKSDEGTPVVSGEEATDVSAISDDNKEIDKSEVVEIKEKMFIAQTNEIYLNADDYIGRTIKYQGLFKPYKIEETGKTYNYVIRYGPGCCGNDGSAGFEIAWDGEYPAEDAWTEVIGVLESYEENSGKYLRLRLSSLTVMEERGAEYVSQ